MCPDCPFDIQPKFPVQIFAVFAGQMEQQSNTWKSGALFPWACQAFTSFQPIMGSLRDQARDKLCIRHKNFSNSGNSIKVDKLKMT